MIKSRLCCFTILMILLAGMAGAEGFQVGDINLSSTNWGNQTVNVNVLNISGEYKWIAVRTQVIFSDSLLTPRRNSQKTIFMEPDLNKKLELPYEFPGNYGRGVVRVSLYELVDTLDPLYESLRFFEKDIPVEFPVPDSLVGLVSDGINVPMYAEKSDLFDNLFNRLFFILLYQGKSLTDIARLTGADSVFVNMTLRRLMVEGLISQTDNVYDPNFAVIDISLISKLRPAMDSTMLSIYNSITAGLPRYDSLVADYLKTGKIKNDKNNLFDPGTVLYHKYPTVIGLLLWNRLGVDFVSDGMPFNIFVGSDPCAARMAEFTHFVLGNGNNMGRSLFMNFNDNNEEGKFYCSGDSVIFNCYLLSSPGVLPVVFDWAVSEKNPMIYFTYNDAVTKEPLAILAGDAIGNIRNLKTKIEMELAGSKNARHIRGIRYWCWNLIVTEVIKKLETDKVLIREGSGLYMFERM
jgi:hypothetical protein